MKLTGMAGVGSGKIGSQVYSAIGNTQIVRNYQPNVANPNTAPQVNVRARFKLLSQISAAVAPVLAFKNDRLVSARNRFVKKNYDLATSNDGQAQLTLENLQLSAGSVGLPGLHASRFDGGELQLELVQDAGSALSRVVYIIFRKADNSRLQLVRSIIREAPTLNNIFRVITADVEGDLVIYAYGIFDNNSRATARYGDFHVQDGQDIAKLVMSRTMSLNDYRFTRTRGLQLYAGEADARSAMGDEVRVFVTASGSGDVSGNGIYERGDEIIITAKPDEGSKFIGWKENGGSDFIAYSPTLVLTAANIIDYVAVFQNPDSTTGGEGGYELTNPLPYADAHVEVDGNVKSIVNGYVELGGVFDNMDVSGVAEDQVLTFVPAGSFLGNDDNITFDYQNGHYTYSVTESGSGAVYLNNNVFFYVNTEVWENPYPNATLTADSHPVTIANKQAIVTAIPDYIYIAGLGATDMVTASYNSTNVPMVRDNNRWRNVNTGVDMPLQVSVNGKPWFTLIMQA